MSQSPVGTVSSVYAKVIGSNSKKDSMDLILSINSKIKEDDVDSNSLHSPLSVNASEISESNCNNFNKIDQMNVMTMMSDAFIFSNLSKSPECTWSSPNCKSFTSLSHSLMNKNKSQDMNLSNDKSVQDDFSLSTKHTTSSLVSESIVLNDLLSGLIFSPKRKKNYSFSSSGCLLPNFDDNFVDNFENYDFTDLQDFTDEFSLNKSNNDNNNNHIVTMINAESIDSAKALQSSHYDIIDLNIEEPNNIDQTCQTDNTEALIAIREMAIKDKRLRQRKHKNSTSSVSSNSMSSKIKKFAFDLQNTTVNLNKEHRNNIQHVPLYSSTTSSNHHENYTNNVYKSEIFINSDNDYLEIDSKLDSDIDLEKINFNIDDDEFGDFFELEGWEQVLDEDCISRLTTDFDANTTENEPITTVSIDTDTKSFFDTNKHLENNDDINELKCEKKTISQISSSSETVVETKMENVQLSQKKIDNKNQLTINPSIKSIKLTEQNTSCTSVFRLPITTVLSSPKTTPRVQNLSSFNSVSSLKKSQPLVVVLSTTSSPSISSTNSQSSCSSKTITTDSASYLSKKINQFKQVIIGNNSKANSSLNHSISIKNNQIKTLNIFGSVQESINSSQKQENHLLGNSLKDVKLISTESNKTNNDNYNTTLVVNDKCLSSNNQDKISLINSNKTVLTSSDDSTNIRMQTKHSTSISNEEKTQTKSNFNSFGSIIDPSNENIDCINPDQIFPNRLAKFDKDHTNYNQIDNILETNLKLEKQAKANDEIDSKHTNEDDEDEEIDVVSVNNICSTSLIESNSIGKMSSKLNSKLLAREHSELNNVNQANNINLNHHNYFYQPSSYAVTNKKFNPCLKVQESCKISNQKDQSSLLARYLKSSSSIQSSSTSPVPASPSSPKKDSTQQTVDKFSANSIQNKMSADGGKKRLGNISLTSKVTKSSETLIDPNASQSNTSKNIQILNKQKTLGLNNQNQKTLITTEQTKSIASPHLMQQSTNSILNVSNSNHNKKNSITSIQPGNLSTTTNGSCSLTSNVLISGQQKVPNSIRVLTTTASNSNSAIRQINQTTTISSNTTSQHNTASLNNNKTNSSNIIQVTNQTPIKSSICTITKNISTTKSSCSNESKVLTTTNLISKTQNTNFFSNNSNKISQINSEHSLIDSNFSKKIIKTIRDSNDIDFKQKLLFSNLNINKNKQNIDRDKSSSKLIKSSSSDFTSVDDEYESDFEDNTEGDDDVDDDDDEDDISSESVDEESADDNCSTISPLQINSSFSPILSTSCVNSSSSSGYSTPTKSNLSKLKQAGTYRSSSKDLSAYDVTLKAKKMRKNKLNSCGQMPQLGKQASFKRNNRQNLLGYSSENPAEKRAFHILSERQRRNDLKKLFETLRINIPNLSEKQKASKLTILKAAVDHLVEISNRKEKLSIIFDKEKQKNVELMQNLKKLEQSFNINHNFVNQSPTSSMTTLFIH